MSYLNITLISYYPSYFITFPNESIGSIDVYSLSTKTKKIDLDDISGTGYPISSINNQIPTFDGLMFINGTNIFSSGLYYKKTDKWGIILTNTSLLDIRVFKIVANIEIDTQDILLLNSITASTSNIVLSLTDDTKSVNFQISISKIFGNTIEISQNQITQGAIITERRRSLLDSNMNVSIINLLQINFNEKRNKFQSIGTFGFKNNLKKNGIILELDDSFFDNKK
ncbi:MAG: hypothetical protein GY830_02990 [Bacteroidetes bacterium]|nr:hypothetical protein [Bacteroidota bacterium]